MTAHKDKNGNWYVQYRVKNVSTGKWIHKKKRGFATKREALAYERKAIESAEISTKEKKTFEVIMHEQENFADCTDVVRQHHEFALKHRFNQYRNLPITSFTKPMLQEWRTWLSEQDYSTPVKNKTIGYVKATFKYASDMYDIPNPSTMLRNFPKTEEEKTKEMQVWTVDEFNNFIAQFKDKPVWHAYFSTLFWTGMRRGEAIALSGDDLGDGWIFIHSSQFLPENGRKSTKTGTSRRIRIDSNLNHELHELRDKFGGEYLFGGDVPLTPYRIQYSFEKGIERCRNKPIRLHDLRHSHATMLINNGINIVAISKRLGHSTTQETLNVYSHLLPETDEQLIDFVEKVKKL